MISDPVTSIVIPARDAEKTIARTLESLLAQTNFRWEALVVDDGSVDRTSEIIADYVARDTRFVALRSFGKGASAARNLGLFTANGERIVFLDSDDWIDRQFLVKMNAALNSNSSAVAAYCNYCRVLPDGRETPARSDPGVEKNPFETFARTCAVAIHGVLVKKSVVLQVGSFDTDLRTCEDWDLWQRIAREGGSWIHVNEKLSYYWVSDHSLTQDVHQMMVDARTVIARGFSNDARVADPAPPHRAGASTIHGSTPTAAYAYFALWCAGFDCGRGKAGDPSHETLLELPRTEDSADTIAGILLDSIMVGIREPPTKLAECWSRYGQGVTDLITEIGRAWNSPKAARKIQYRFERMVLDYDDLSSARALFLTLGVRVDLRRLGAVLPADSIDRLYVYLCNGPSILAVVDIGVLGAVDRDFWITTLTRHFDHFMGRVIRLEIQINKLTKYLPSLVRQSNGGSHQHRLRELRTTMSHQATPLNIGTLGTSKGIGSRGREKTRDGARKSFWEDLFEEEDPWNYGSPYEQEKYQRQIEMLPAGKAERALELACAEGHFTSQVAPKVKHLLASDISTRALQRARDRCRGHANVDFIQLDLSTTVLPREMDLIICSEVLYYLNDEAELVAVTRRLAQALRPGGHLLTAHAFVLKDNMSRSGFDWENPYGAETIARALESVPDLALEASVQTELYRIDRFRRLHVGEIVSEPVTRVVAIDAPIETEVARFIVRNGAVARRAELAQTERPSQLPILMYHRVASDGPKKLAQLRLSPSAFHAQMLWLRRNGYHTINSEQLAWFVANDYPFVGRPVLITFDDGYKDFAEHAWPILRAHDFSAEVFIVTDLVGGNANWDASYGTPAPLMSAVEIAMLAAEGVSFGSHLASHPRSDELSTRELAEELTRSRAQLEKWLNRSITSFAAPFGCLDQRLRILAAECGFKTGFGTISGAANLKCDLLNLPRIEVRGEWSLDNFVSCMESYL